MQDPIKSWTLPMKQLQNWFPEQLVLHKRVAIQKMILAFQKKINPALAYDATKDIIPSLGFDPAKDRDSGPSS